MKRLMLVVLIFAALLACVSGCYDSFSDEREYYELVITEMQDEINRLKIECIEYESDSYEAYDSYENMEMQYLSLDDSYTQLTEDYEHLLRDYNDCVYLLNQYGNYDYEEIRRSRW